MHEESEPKQISSSVGRVKFNKLPSDSRDDCVGDKCEKLDDGVAPLSPVTLVNPVPIDIDDVVTVVVSVTSSS